MHREERVPCVPSSSSNSGGQKQLCIIFHYVTILAQIFTHQCGRRPSEIYSPNRKSLWCLLDVDVVFILGAC